MDKSLPRRKFLKLVGAGAITAGTGKAIDNVVLGYGELGNGENLRTQDLPAHLSANLGLGDIQSPIRWEPMSVTSFFDHLDTVTPDVEAVTRLRGSDFTSVSPETVREFTGDAPRNPQAVIDGLVTAFRRHAYYDVPRYVAGSIEDNLLFGAGDLRAPFRTDVSFEALATADDRRGMFCFEFAWRSIEALHAVAPTHQSPPVFGGWVIDDRHKHVYTAVASAYRESGGTLVLPVTFIDYTHTTLYDTLHATSLLGDGLDAYNSRHRATSVWWEY